MPIVLVGNKVDLVGQHDRQVERREGLQRAQKWRCGFFETSAKTRLNIEEAFGDLIRHVKQAQQRRLDTLARPTKTLPAPSREDPDPVEGMLGDKWFKGKFCFLFWEKKQNSAENAHESPPRSSARGDAPKKKKKKRKCVIL